MFYPVATKSSPQTSSAWFPPDQLRALSICQNKGNVLNDSVACECARQWIHVRLHTC